MQPCHDRLIRHGRAHVVGKPRCSVIDPPLAEAASTSEGPRATATPPDQGPMGVSTQSGRLALFGSPQVAFDGSEGSANADCWMVSEVSSDDQVHEARAGV